MCLQFSMLEPRSQAYGWQKPYWVCNNFPTSLLLLKNLKKRNLNLQRSTRHSQKYFPEMPELIVWVWGEVELRCLCVFFPHGLCLARFVERSINGHTKFVWVCANQPAFFVGMLCLNLQARWRMATSFPTLARLLHLRIKAIGTCWSWPHKTQPLNRFTMKRTLQLSSVGVHVHDLLRSACRSLCDL